MPARLHWSRRRKHTQLQEKKPTMKCMLSVLGIAALAAAVPAHATVYTVNFTGTVFQSIGATGEPVGSTVAGRFDLDSTTSSFLDFTIAGQSVAPGYQSFASI